MMRNPITALSRRTVPVLAAGLLGLLLVPSPAISCPKCDKHEAAAKGENHAACADCEMHKGTAEGADKEACGGDCADCRKAKEEGGACPCAAAAAAAAAAGSSQPAPADKAAPAAPGAAKQRVYIDPSTGQPGTPPPGADLAAPQAPAAARTGGAEELVPLPGGGVKAELGDAYRANLEAKRGPDGKIHVGCDQDSPHKAPAQEPPAAHPGK